jgi:hypothetical protein
VSKYHLGMQRARPRRAQSSTPLPDPFVDTPPRPQHWQSAVSSVPTSLLSKADSRKPASSPSVAIFLWAQPCHLILKPVSSPPRPSTFNVNLLKRRLESLPDSGQEKKKSDTTVGPKPPLSLLVYSPLLDPY